jgi:hypothetical protein
VLGELDERGVEAFLSQVGDGTRSGLMFAELRHLGGALARPDAGGGAVSALPGVYALHTVAVAPTPQAAVAGRAAGFAVVRAMAPWTVPGLLPTFTDTRVEPERLHEADRLARLRAVRDAIDPRQRFVANHAI